MVSISIRVAALGLVAGYLGGCGSDDFVEAQFGYDERPVNATCKAPPRPTSDTGIKLERVFAGITFNAPTLILQAPGDDTRFYVIEQSGKLRSFTATDTTATDVLTYAPGEIRSGGEMGFLGFAFAPDWPTSHVAYVSVTKPGGSTNVRSVVSRMKSTDGGKTLDRSTEQELLVFEQPYENHNGGNIAFGPDGYLYLGFGDGGSGGDPQGNGQKLSVPLGKMLRIDVSGGGPYKIPADNPFVGVAGAREEIWAYGLRNPWRWSFDRATGDLWVGDVGQNAWEEVDVIKRGGNYGWNTREGTHCYGGATCATAGFVEPVVDYSHADGVSITGGHVYRGTAIPALVGTYLYGDYGSGKIWGLFPEASSGKLSAQLLIESGFNIPSFGQGNDGEVYVIDYSGKINKIVPSGKPGAIGFPQKLSATGCVDAADHAAPAPGVIPYSVNVPFWSDGADKERFFAIPDGTQIGVATDGDLDLPIGSVTMKHFRVGGDLLETRLFVRHADGWAGYTYEWDADGKDATLVVGGKTKARAGGQWSYPSGAQCLQCHNTAAGSTLGLEVRQLARTNDYPATGRRAPQLDTLVHLGMFDKALPAIAALPSVDAVADPSMAPTVETRARAYLHVNCAFCHRPMGTGQGPQDLRFERALKETMLCNALPTQGTLGVASAKLVTPGDPTQSVVSLRLHATDTNRMPPLASLVPDADGTALIDNWIRTLSSCPP